MGFWPVVPFAGLEVGALGAAFWVSMRRNRYREVLDVVTRIELADPGMAYPLASSLVQLAHARALREGVKTHGCTVHFVTPQLDHGPIIIQATVPVLPDDTEQTLAARVLQQEHHIYPQAVRWFAQDKLKLAGNRVEILETAAAADTDATSHSPQSSA